MSAFEYVCSIHLRGLLELDHGGKSQDWMDKAMGAEGEQARDEHTAVTEKRIMSASGE